MATKVYQLTNQIHSMLVFDDSKSFKILYQDIRFIVRVKRKT